MDNQLPRQPTTENAPEDETLQPISIRKLDRLETTYFSNPNGA